MSGSQQDPEIVTYRIPRIEVYQITDDEMCRIEEGCGKDNQDFAFAMSFLSFGVAFFLALKSATFTETTHTIFIVIIIGCAVGCLYTGFRWITQRNRVPDVIAKIRSRRTEPQVPSSIQH